MRDVVDQKSGDLRRSSPVGDQAASRVAASGSKYPHTIGLRLGVNLYATAENALEGAHRAGDYSLTSMPDLIRTALAAHFDGMTLTAAPEMGGKRRTTIGLDDALKSRYDQLPHRKRGEIIERALRTFLNRGMTMDQ
jgi:hypothetical protein